MAPSAKAEGWSCHDPRNDDDPEVSHDEIGAMRPTNVRFSFGGHTKYDDLLRSKLAECDAIIDAPRTARTTATTTTSITSTATTTALLPALRRPLARAVLASTEDKIILSAKDSPV